MKQLKAISYPRSGVSIFCRLLEDYYEEKKRNNKAYFCNSVGCCGHKQPCAKTKNFDLDLIYMKNHDFGSKIQNIVDPDIIHVILYRKSALEQMNAYFRYSLDGKKYMEPHNRKDDYQHSGRRGQFIGQLTRKANFVSYRAFTQKWVYDNNNPYTYFLEYDDYMSDPLKHMSNIIKIIDGQVDTERLGQIITKHNVKKHFDIKESVYHIENFCETYGLHDVEFDPANRFLN